MGVLGFRGLGFKDSSICDIAKAHHNKNDGHDDDDDFPDHDNDDDKDEVDDETADDEPGGEGSSGDQGSNISNLLPLSMKMMMRITISRKG